MLPDRFLSEIIWNFTSSSLGLVVLWSDLLFELVCENSGYCEDAYCCDDSYHFIFLLLILLYLGFIVHAAFISVLMCGSFCLIKK